MEEALAAAIFALPISSAYSNVPKDLVPALRKRDMKLATVLNEQMLEDVGELILPTFLLPLSFEQAIALCDSHFHSSIGNYKEEHKKTIQALQRQVDNAVSKMETTTSKFFVKLSFMSPKDIAIQSTNKKTCKNLYQELDKVYQTLKQPQHISFQSCAITRAWLNSLYRSLGVKNGEEAIYNIIQSYRTHEELLESILCKEYFPRTNIVLRPWLNIRPGFEFRVFVSNKKVTCISQYESVFYPAVWEGKEKYFRAVFDFVSDRVIDCVAYRLPSFVVDIVVDFHDQLFICEFNPFASTSSACLFSWTSDRNSIMLGPIEMRCVPPPSKKKCKIIISKKGRSLRYWDVLQEKEENEFYCDDGTDSYGLTLSDEWEYIISSYWKRKISKDPSVRNKRERRSFFYVLAILLLLSMVSFWFGAK